MPTIDLPKNYARIQRVNSFQELRSTPFKDGINAFCWERALPGNFQEIAEGLKADQGINAIEDNEITSLSLSETGKIAARILLEDQRMLRECGLEPILDCVNHYQRDETDTPIHTDVFSFHVDSATIEADTYLCTYFGPPSEGLRNDEAQRCVDTTQTRIELLSQFGGPDDTAFEAYLEDHCFDLHYTPLPGAQPFSFGIGNLWRIAIKWPGSPVPPCIHRAPATIPGQKRLLLIS